MKTMSAKRRAKVAADVSATHDVIRKTAHDLFEKATGHTLGDGYWTLSEDLVLPATPVGGGDVREFVVTATTIERTFGTTEDDALTLYRLLMAVEVADDLLIALAPKP